MVRTRKARATVQREPPTTLTPHAAFRLCCTPQRPLVGGGSHPKAVRRRKREIALFGYQLFHGGSASAAFELAGLFESAALPTI
jgi:hypothetical protein